MQTVSEVLHIIEREVRPSEGVERVGIAGAYGRILGEEVRMDTDSPPFDRALLDGFAVRSVDAMEGAWLGIIGRQDAGLGVFAGAVGEGECVGINTGGVMPKGTDGVLMVEHSLVEGERVRVGRAVGKEYGVQRRGADARAGAEVLSAGTLMGAAQLAVAVAAGVGELVVKRRVRVGVLTTGDELVAAGGAISGGQIRNSNHPMLMGLVREVLGENGEVIDLGSCGDERKQLNIRLGYGLSKADVVIVSGGMSMGTRDLVPVVLKGLEVKFLVEKVRMKPGKPFVFGVRDWPRSQSYVCGLPGNPVSAFVTFEVFVRGVLERLLEVERERWVKAVAGEVFAANGDREFFQPCVVERGAALTVRPLKWKGSGDVFTLARAQGLVRRGVNAEAVVVEGVLEVMML